MTSRSAAIRLLAARRSATVRASSLRSSSTPGPGARRGDQHLGVVQALGVEQPDQVGLAVLHLLRGEQVRLVEHHRDDRGVAGQRGEIAAVHGRVRVLLRVQHPDHQVGHPDQAVGLVRGGRGHRVVVRQVDQDQAAQRGLTLAQRAGSRVPVPWRDAQPLQQLGGAVHAPHAGMRVLGERPDHADGREIGPGQPVEQRGLAAPGAAGQHRHGVVGRHPEPLPGPGDQLLRVVQQGPAEPVRAAAGRPDLDHPGQRGQPGGQVSRPGRLARRRAGRSRAGQPGAGQPGTGQPGRPVFADTHRAISSE